MFWINAQNDDPGDSFYETATGMGVLCANKRQGVVDYRTVAGRRGRVDADLFAIEYVGAF